MNRRGGIALAMLALGGIHFAEVFFVELDEFNLLMGSVWTALGSWAFVRSRTPLIESSAASDSSEAEKTDGDGANDESPTENK